VPAEYLLAHRLNIVQLKTCWTQANYLPGEETLAVHEQRALRNGRQGFRVIVRAESEIIPGEVITARHVIVSCDNCDEGLIGDIRGADANLKSKSPQQIRRTQAFIDGRYDFIWKLPGGAADRFASETLPEVRSLPPDPLRGRLYTGQPSAVRRNQIPEDVARFKQLFESCFTSSTPPDQKTQDDCFPRDKIDPYTMGPDKLENFYYGRFWLREPFIVSPPWSIHEQRETIRGALDSKLRDLRGEFVAQIREDSRMGILSAHLRALDVARVRLHMALALGFQQQLLMNDSTRALIFGPLESDGSLPRSRDLVRMLDANDSDYRQIEKLLVIVSRPTDEIRRRASSLGNANRFEPFSRLLDEIKSVKASAIQASSVNTGNTDPSSTLEAPAPASR
jgi:hypothetical protein